MKNQKGYTIVELIFAVVIVIGIFGWIWNVVKLVGILHDPITGMFIARIIGIIVPFLGAILGFL